MTKKATTTKGAGIDYLWYWKWNPAWLIMTEEDESVQGAEMSINGGVPAKITTGTVGVYTFSG